MKFSALNSGRRGVGPIGVDVGAHSVKAVQIERTRSSARIACAMSMPRTAPGTPVDPAEARRIVDALWRHGFGGTRLALAVPSDKLLSSVMELPPRQANVPLHDIALQETARASKCDPAQMEMAWWELPGGARAAEGTHVMAVACRHTDADAFLDHFESAGAEVVALEPAPTALARACTPNLAPDPGLTALLELGWSAAQLLVLQGSIIVYERSTREHGLSALASMLTSKLADADPTTVRAALDHLGCLAQVPAELAGWDQADRAAALTGSFIDEIADEVRLSLAYAERRFGSVPSSLLLSGGGSAVPGLVDRVRARAAINTVPVCAADLFPAAPEVRETCARAPLVLALGLALHEPGGDA